MDRHARSRSLDRRAFLEGLGGLGALGLLPPAARGAADGTAPLVLLQLSGGNDGLSTLVPHGDDAYHRARPALAVDPKAVHALDDYRGLHPELGRLAALFGEGKLALVQGVGYPDAPRSHFKSLEVWHAADPRGRVRGEGWIGALCRAAYGEAAHPNRVVHVGGKPPYSLHSAVHAPAAFATPATYRRVGGEEEVRGFERAEGSDSKALAFLRRRLRDARTSAAEVRDVVAAYRSPVAYPRDRFADSLRVAAALVAGSPETRVVSLELSGFDTHNDQRRRHASLMRTLDAALPAFLADLERTEAGRRAVVLVFSEFGRRVAENASGGTDHGSAGVALALGARVNGGLYGRHPALDELERGDLVFTTDFRSVYAAGIAACFDVDPARVLGAEYPRLELFA